jgi:hypothetical protein
MDAVAASPASALLDRPGGVFIRRGEQMSEEDRSLLQTVARVVLQDDAGTLIEQVDRRARVECRLRCCAESSPNGCHCRTGSRAARSGVLQ